MDFRFTEEQEKLRKEIHDFFVSEVPFRKCHPVLSSGLYRCGALSSTTKPDQRDLRSALGAILRRIGYGCGTVTAKEGNPKIYLLPGAVNQ